MSGTENKSQIPNWLTDEYIGKIFSDFVSQERSLIEPIDWEIEIQDFHKNLEDVSTNLIKVKVINKKNPKEEFNSIFKTISDAKPNYLNVSLAAQEDMLKREGILYRDYLSEVSKIIDSIDDCEMLFPKLFHFSVNPTVLVIEDMTPYNFEKFTEAYSLEDCKKVFRNLGKFHAISYYVHHELKKDLSVYDNFMWKDLTTNIPIVQLAYQEFLEVIDTWEGCSEFADKLRKFQPYYCEKIVSAAQENPGGFSVLNHGDIHKSNYLFRNNKEDIVTIDYQMSGWRSPAYDIILAFNSIYEPDDNINSRMILLKSYHNEFRMILKELQFSHKIPSLLDLHVEVLKSGILDLTFWSIYNPLEILDNLPDDGKDFNERFREALNSPRQKRLAECFQTFIDRGYLEYEEEENTS